MDKGCHTEKGGRRTIGVYCENHTRHKNTMHMDKAEEPFLVEAGGTYNYHSVLKEQHIPEPAFIMRPVLVLPSRHL
jgi:hypothetical protein